VPSSPSGARLPQTRRRTATVEFVRGSVRGTRRRALATLPSLFTLANMM
jgi:CDP-diacylglycerol--serine O-phosphatidyltransferase